MDIKDIKDLITIINSTDIETVEIQKSDIRIMITKGNGTSSNTQKIDQLADQEIVKEVKVVEKDTDTTADDNIYMVRSPMVGTFYASSSPGAAPFVKVGDKVEHGQTLCIVEAMKTMNEIESEVSGEVVEMLVSDEDIVEYGQALMKVRR